MEEDEEVTDEFDGVQVWWVLEKNIPKTQTISLYHTTEEKNFYKLTFHKRYRKLITGPYINHVLKEGKAKKRRDRQRKLYSNISSKDWNEWDDKWSHVYFKHPATFDTLAMATKTKEAIMKDLKKFSEAKEYYAKMGKAWKRGYLLYGPPGTGKSTLIAAMSNFLNYDVYDLELTTVEDNNKLRSLLIETTDKSIIVIEDIDCSLDVTGHRADKDEKNEEKKEEKLKKKAGKGKKKSNVTLSGLLNIIDGLWSACGGERIIIFTTNHIDKLDPALIRRGRMDKHIEMSYCCFEAFKVLAKNYLDVESHELFADIGSLLDETNMTPADVAENLMPKSDDDDTETCLNNLIRALKENAGKKALNAKSEEQKEGKVCSKEAKKLEYFISN